MYEIRALKWKINTNTESVESFWAETSFGSYVVFKYAWNNHWVIEFNFNYPNNNSGVIGKTLREAKIKCSRHFKEMMEQGLIKKKLK